jgi:hypothetical protein
MLKLLPILFLAVINTANVNIFEIEGIFSSGISRSVKNPRTKRCSCPHLTFAFGKERERIYDTATKARAIENGNYFVASSTTGKGLMDFIGKSRIVHPSGKVIAEIEEGEGMITAELDTTVLQHYRYEETEDSHAYFSNRRKELYGEICRIRGPSEGLP